MTLGRSPLPQSEPTPEYWQLLYKQADFRTQQFVAERERSSSVPDEVKLTKTRQGPTDWNCASRCRLRYRQSAAGIHCRLENLDLCKLVAESEAVGTRRSRRSRRRPGRDQKIGIVLCATSSYITSPPLGYTVVKKT